MTVTESAHRVVLLMSTRPGCTTKWVLGGVLSFALLLRLVIALTVPPWQGPDEPKHFEYIHTLVEKRAQLWTEHRLPNGAVDVSPELERQIIVSMAAHYYWEYLDNKTPARLPANFNEIWGAAGSAMHAKSALTPLYYLLGSLALFPFQGAGLEQQLLILRLFSAILSVATVAVTYCTARELMFEDFFVPAISAAFVAALPMHAFVGAVVNTDNLVTLLGALVALALARGFMRGFTLRRCAFVLVALGLALVAKRTAAALLPAILVTGLFSIASMNRGRLQLGAIGLGVMAVATVIVGALAVGRVLLGETDMRALAMHYSLNELGERQLQMFLHVPFRSPETWGLVLWHLDALFRSFWGIFGWFNVPMDPWLYQILYGATAVSGIGFVAWLVPETWQRVKRSGCWPNARLPLVMVYLLAIASTITLAVCERLPYLSRSEMPQGRYLFVVVTPIAIVFALGARRVLPKRYRASWKAAIGIMLGLSALDLIAYFGCILPHYAR